jgi:hypothetical protein
MGNPTVGQSVVDAKCAGVLAPSQLNIHDFTTPLDLRFHRILHNKWKYNSFYEGILNGAHDCCQFLKTLKAIIEDVWLAYTESDLYPKGEEKCSVWERMFRYRGSRIEDAARRFDSLIDIACNGGKRAPLDPLLYPDIDYARADSMYAEAAIHFILHVDAEKAGWPNPHWRRPPSVVRIPRDITDWPHPGYRPPVYRPGGAWKPDIRPGWTPMRPIRPPARARSLR